MFVKATGNKKKTLNPQSLDADIQCFLFTMATDDGRVERPSFMNMPKVAENLSLSTK